MRERKVQIPRLSGATYNGKPAPGWTTFRIFKCADCKRIKQSTDAMTTGYGSFGKSKRKVCFECCGKREARDMAKTGKATLYLVSKKDGYHVTNWPGTLDIRAGYVKRGGHNIGRTRFDAWFSFAGATWHGVNIGDNDILRCKRLKAA